LDTHVFTFLVALVQHHGKRVYDSAIASFCAARSTVVNPADHTMTWRPEGEVSGIFSKLIYCGQLIILQQARHLAEEQDLDELSEPLGPLCAKWIVSNTRGPMGTLGD
jgi:hypothetical protein